MLTRLCLCIVELQGHAIKNQDLMIASGAVSLKGSEGMSSLDDDVQAATVGLHHLSYPSYSSPSLMHDDSSFTKHRF
jgi:hypothetical protein